MKDLRFVHSGSSIPDNLKSIVAEYHIIGKKFNSENEILRTNKAEYDKEEGNKWKIFKDKWLEITHFRCPICESQINRYDDIEHFRPKEHYWWLAYDYHNYYICCDLCNSSFKRNKFPLLDDSKRVTFDNKDEIVNEIPLLFNPLKDNPIDLFKLEFKNEGGKTVINFHPKNSDSSSLEYKIAQTTIDIFQLNNQKNKYPERKNLKIEFGSRLIQLVRSYKNFIENPNDKNAKRRFAEEYCSLKESNLGFIKQIREGICVDNT